MLAVRSMRKIAALLGIYSSSQRLHQLCVYPCDNHTTASTNAATIALHSGNAGLPFHRRRAIALLSQYRSATTLKSYSFPPSKTNLAFLLDKDRLTFHRLERTTVVRRNNSGQRMRITRMRIAHCGRHTAFRQRVKYKPCKMAGYPSAAT